jgi:acyl-CoA reductase-like NAD-dependent aldehyde dehydrogenase
MTDSSTTANDSEFYTMLIDGDWRAATDEATFSSINPYDGRVWAHVPAATDADVDAAVVAARRAFDTGPWPHTTPLQRATLLRKFGDLIRSNADELARIQVLENGKLIREVAGQTLALANHCYFFAGVAESPTGETLASSVPNMQVFTVREPIGVVAAITPWNSPLALLLWKMCPALAAGNTMVIKPSEITPVSTLVLARLAQEAGFPDGVVNVVTGAGPTGAARAGPPDVDKIACTGSTASRWN